MLNVNTVFAQTENGETHVKIIVNIMALGHNNITLKGKHKPVWKFYNGDIDKGGQELTNYKNETCFSKKKSKKNNQSKELDEDQQSLRPFEASSSGFTFTMEAFINTKGTEKCEADSKDKLKGIKVQFFKLDKLAPDQWSEEFRIEDNFGRFWSAIKYKYTLIGGLNEIKSSSKEIINDVTQTIELSLPITLPNKENLPFIWKYSTGDDNNWKTIPNANQDKSSIKINPIRDIFNGKLNSPQKVSFKAEVEMKNKSEYSDDLPLSFTPPPPDFDEKDKKIFNSCSGIANGGIQINNIKTNAAEIKYVLRKKTELSETCNLEDPDNEDCPGFIQTGNLLSSRPLEINNLGVGDYVLYLFNADLESGIVNKKMQFTIPELPMLKFNDDGISSKDPTCLNEKGGEINMSVNGGADLWQIAIIPNKGRLDWVKDNILFKELEGGKYTVYLTDKCGAELHPTFTLIRPETISIENWKPIQQKDEFLVQLILKNGSGDYTVKVTDPNMNVTNPLVISDVNIPISEVGIYSFEVTDNKKSGCAPARMSVKVEKSKTKSAKYKITAID